MRFKQFRSSEEFDNAMGDDNSTSFIGYIEASPAELVRLLGKPCPSDSYKVSGEYLLRIWDTFVTIYDWKMTSLYDEDYIDPKDFWKSEERVTFNVGADKEEGTADIIHWLLELIRNEKLQKMVREVSNG